jgi:transketolase
VLVPADTWASKCLFDVALQTPGPAFVRLMRDPLFDLYEPGDSFRMGGSHVVLAGNDVTIATYGDIVFEAIGAAGILSAEGIRAEVIDLYSLKPFDRETLLGSLDKTGALVVAENHQKRNGLGYELSNFCLKHKIVAFDNLGLEDTFAESGSYNKLLGKYGLSKFHIAEAARRLLRRI